MCKNKKVVAIIASGGSYKQAGMSALVNELDVSYAHESEDEAQIRKFVVGTGAVAQGRISPEDFLAPYLHEIPGAVGQTEAAPR